jgi:hypothetical protein
MSFLRRRGLGCLRDEPDPRDFRLSALDLTHLPPSATVRAGITAKEQGGTQSCTGQAVAQALRAAYIRNGVDCPELSALAPYYWSRVPWGAQNSDGGARLHDVLGVVQKLGCPDETSWPFSTFKVNSPPKPSAIFSAAKRRGLRGYHRVSTVTDVRLAIAAGFPVVASWELDRAFLENAGGANLIDAPTGVLIGRHAMMIESYEPDRTFVILNSWGSDWRWQGRAYVTENFVSKLSDAWAIDVRGKI